MDSEEKAQGQKRSIDDAGSSGGRDLFIGRRVKREQKREGGGVAVGNGMEWLAIYWLLLVARELVFSTDKEGARGGRMQGNQEASLQKRINRLCRAPPLSLSLWHSIA